MELRCSLQCHVGGCAHADAFQLCAWERQDNQYEPSALAMQSCHRAGAPCWGSVVLDCSLQWKTAEMARGSILFF